MQDYRYRRHTNSTIPNGADFQLKPCRASQAYWEGIKTDAIALSSIARTVGIIMAIAALVLLLGCRNVTTQNQIAKQTALPDGAASQVGTGYLLGEPRAIGNLTAAVNSIHLSDGKETGLSVSPLEDGLTYLIVDVTVKNTGDASEYVSSRMQVNLIDATGNTQDWATYPALVGSIDGRIAPGQTRQGELSWQVAENAKRLTLMFEDMAFPLGDLASYIERAAVTTPQQP